MGNAGKGQRLQTLDVRLLHCVHTVFKNCGWSCAIQALHAAAYGDSQGPLISCVMPVSCLRLKKRCA